jgi:hypothetical protein
MSNIIIAIGDIHGFKSVLSNLIAQIESKHDIKKVPLVFIGDYVDRGDDELGTLDYLLSLEAKYPHFVFLLGNHEQDWIDFGHPDGKFVDRKYWDFFDRCKIYHTEEKLAFTHGGIPGKYTKIADVPKEKLIRARDTWSGYHEHKLVVGHTPQENVLDAGNCVFLDTGVYLKGFAKLSAVVFDKTTGKILEIIQEHNPKAME